MGSIRLLSDILASQVAAGEVVERPASVVKELVENSLDAGAKKITVEFQRGGTRLIRVTDDGCGMDRSDALLCLERHATSKIRESADLASVLTLGFRGEALPSIASVSRFRLTTRQRESETGVFIEVSGGKLLDVSECGEAVGTRIEVADLFFNVPARRKFLRSEQTESANLLQQIEILAVAHPRISFIVRRDDREVMRLAATEDLAVRLRDLHGEGFLQKLVAVPLVVHEGIRVHGWIARPGEGRSDRSMQLLFVNGRVIQSPVLSLPLREACDGVLAKGLHPPAVLFFELDPREVDCNVHPAKREVRFRNPSLLRAASLMAARAAWEVAAPSGQNPSPTITPAIFSTPPQPPAWKANASAYQQELVSSEVQLSSRVAEEPSPAWSTSHQISPPAPRYLGILANSYLLFEQEESLLLIEIRAARERLLYERAMVRLKTGFLESQRLLMPEVLEMSPAEVTWIDAHRKLLEAAGLVAESFGSKTLKVDAVPAEAAHRSVGEIISLLVDELREVSESPSLDSQAKNALAEAVSRLAASPCSGASLPGGEEAARMLLGNLLACELPYATPSGRPTMSQLSPGELARRFMA